MKNKRTVADQEKLTGKPDSIRNVDGSNSRSDKHIATLNKQAAKLATKLTLPEDVPTGVTFHYAGGDYKHFAGDDAKGIIAFAHATEKI